MKKSFQAFMEKRLPQAVMENFKRESIVAEPGSDQDDRIKKLVSQSLSTAIQEYETETSERPGEADQPSHSRTSIDSSETIKAAAHSEAWDCGGPQSFTGFSRSVYNDVGDMESPEPLSISRSTTTTDSDYSSSAPALRHHNLFALDAAGIGGFMEDSDFPMTTEHAQCWPTPDDIYYNGALQGVGTFTELCPSWSAGSASDERRCSLIGPVLSEPSSYDWPFTTTSPIYGFSEGQSE